MSRSFLRVLGRCAPAFVLLALWAALVSPAAAEPAKHPPLSPLPSGSRVALLPAQSTLREASPVAALQRDEAAVAVATALRKRGYQVMAEEQVGKALSERLPDGCRDAVTCDPKLALHALGVDAVVSLALWQRKDSASELVVFVQRHTNYGQAELALGDAELARVASNAVAKALEDTLVRHEITVRIESEPSGATVHVDQSLAGHTPVTLELAPGNHLVIVETPGFVTDAHYLEIPRSADDPIVHVVKLAQTLPADESEPLPLIAPASPEPAADSGKSDTANYVLAGVLGAVALPLLINAAYAAARDGECTGKRDTAGRCSARATLGAGFWASLGLGVAAGVGAGAVLVFMPLRDTEEQAPTGAALHLHTRF